MKPKNSDELATTASFGPARGPLRLAQALALAGALAAWGWSPALARTPIHVGAGADLASPDGDYLAGLIAAADHDTASAAVFFIGALSADSNNEQLSERAFVALLANGNLGLASQVAKDLLKRDPNNSLAKLVLGAKALKGKDYTKAAADFSVSGGASDVTSDLLTAWSQAGAGKTKQAVATLHRLDQTRFKVFRDYHEGLIDELAKRTEDARKHLKSAYDADPQTLRIVDAWARFSDRHGDAKAAKRAYLAFDKLLPRHPLVLAALAKLKKGKTLSPLVRSAQAGAAEVLYGLGAAGGQQSDDVAAMIYLRLALYLAPTDDLARVTLADLYERVGQHKIAIDLYKSVPKTSPFRDNAQVQIALISDELGHHKKAIERLTQMTARRPHDVEALTALANLQRTHKDYAKAEETYTKALAASGGESVKTNWSILYFRGICNERVGHWPAAEADFKQALTLYPDQPLVLNYLGYSWINKNLHLNKGLQMLQKAVALQPEDGYIVDSLGWAYYKLGKYHHAERLLQRAVALKPADPTLNEHLGDVEWRLGHKLEAHFQWNYARDFHPEPKNLPRILQKIAHGMAPRVPPASSGEGAPSPAQPKSGG